MSGNNICPISMAGGNPVTCRTTNCKLYEFSSSSCQLVNLIAKANEKISK